MNKQEEKILKYHYQIWVVLANPYFQSARDCINHQQRGHKMFYFCGFISFSLEIKAVPLLHVLVKPNPTNIGVVRGTVL